MKVFIGSIIIIMLAAFVLWLCLAPTYKSVGSKAKKLMNKAKDDEKDESE